jgi:hypothetical protein
MTDNTNTNTNTTNNALNFGFGNAKLSLAISHFSLPSGHTCPFAKDCLSKADKVTGKITDGKNCKFRCFSASQECTYPPTRKQRWNNFEKLIEADTTKKMAMLIQDSLPKEFTTIRVHIAGDFFNEKYFLAWLNVAYNNPQKTFYGYTKALPFLVKYKDVLPYNFRFTASKGGTHDHLIKQYNLRYAEVVYSLFEAKYKGLEIDHNDSCAIVGTNNFALLLHNVQPSGSDAAEAWQKLKNAGIGGYNEKRQRFGDINKPSQPKWQIYVSISKSGKIILNKDNNKDKVKNENPTYA